MKDRGPKTLPRGQQALTPEEVRADQERRLLDAIVDLVAESGYRRATVAKVIERAGVSRTTFYDLYDDRSDCFDAAHQDAIQRVDRALKKDSFLAALAELFARRPALAWLLFVAPPVAGPTPAKAYLAATTRWSKRLARDLDALQPISANPDPPLELDRMALAGVGGLLARGTGAGVAGPELADLIYVAMLPRLGPDAARVVSERHRENE